MRLAIRGVGWLLIAAGVVVALYLVYNLYWTGRETARAQAELLEEWELVVGDIDQAIAADELPARGDGEPAIENAPAVQAPEEIEVGEAVAALEFVRPGSDEPLLLDDPLFIVEGVGIEELKTGPGRYPGTALPGQQGNFAIAGHRTTYGAPFFDLDRIRSGDEIHVTDRQGVRWVYEVVEDEIVSPYDVHVLGADPLDLARPMLTLTTCNPRFSNRERLIVYAALVDEQLGQAEGFTGEGAAPPSEIVGEDV